MEEVIYLVGGGNWGERGGGKEGRTYARGVSAVALVAEGAFADDLAIGVGFVVRFDVSGS